MVEDFIRNMNFTSVHDLQPNRTISAINGFIARSYPISMKYAKGRWLHFRQIVLEDASGWVLVNVWGKVATELLRGQKIHIKKSYCFYQNGALCLTLSIGSRLKICTQG
jgi:hypothetical protein